MRLLKQLAFGLAYLFTGISLCFAAERSYVIRNVNLIPMDSARVLEHRSVLIRGDHIEKIYGLEKFGVGKAQIIDGTGLYLMPGMGDMHAHLPGKFGEKHDLSDYLSLNLACGVTTLRSMRGELSHPALRDSLRIGQLFGPQLYISSPAFYDTMLNVDSLRDLYRSYKAARFDFAKYLGGLQPAQFDTFAQLVHDAGLELAGHVPRPGLETAIRHHMASVEHMDAFIKVYEADSTRLDSLLQALARAHIFHCPDVEWYYVACGLSDLDTLKRRAGMEFVDSTLKAEWIESWNKDLAEQQQDTQKYNENQAKWRRRVEVFKRILKRENDAGVRLLVSGSEGGFIVPGFTYRDELQRLVDAGLSPYDVLRAATVNAAACCHQADVWGQIKEGMRADLVLLSANPLTDIANIRQVQAIFVRGKLVTPTELESRLTTMK